MKRKHTRIYPDINVGDYVKIYNKKNKFDKERIPVWSRDKFKVESINDSLGQNFYKVEGRPRELMRFEIISELIYHLSSKRSPITIFSKPAF